MSSGAAAVAVDVAGWAGAAALLAAYALVSAGRVQGRGAAFQVLNLAGSAGLLLNGAWHGAWPSAALNAVWLLVGGVALGRAAASRRAQPRTEPARGGSA